MDIVTALAVLSPFPVDMQEQHLSYQGAYHPRIIPVEALNHEQLSKHLLNGISTDSEIPILIALRLNKEELTWQFLDNLSPQHNISAKLDHQMRQWVQQKLKQHEIPSNGASFYINAKAHNTIKMKRIITKADSSVRSMLNALQWPLWHGPVLFELGDTQKIHAHPLMPVITLEKNQWNEHGLSAALCRLSLLRYQKGTAAQIPEWILQGLSLVAQHKTEGSGPSPRKMLKLRQKAGATAIKNMWNKIHGQAFSADLAKACCAPLVHTRHKHKLASFLTLLNNQIDVEQAMRIAYQRDLSSLLSKP